MDEPRADNPEAVIATAAESGAVVEHDTEVRCGWCGYDLRGMAWVGVCPECGNDYDAKELIRLRGLRIEPWVKRLRFSLGFGVVVQALILLSSMIPGGAPLEFACMVVIGGAVHVVFSLVCFSVGIARYQEYVKEFTLTRSPDSYGGPDGHLVVQMRCLLVLNGLLLVGYILLFGACSRNINAR
jgi:hypothetical protein